MRDTPPPPPIPGPPSLPTAGVRGAFPERKRVRMGFLYSINIQTGPGGGGGGSSGRGGGCRTQLPRPAALSVGTDLSQKCPHFPPPASAWTSFSPPKKNPKPPTFWPLVNSLRWKRCFSIPVGSVGCGVRGGSVVGVPIPPPLGRGWCRRSPKGKKGEKTTTTKKTPQNRGELKRRCFPRGGSALPEPRGFAPRGTAAAPWPGSEQRQIAYS